jgi:hypothetical protein
MLNGNPWRRLPTHAPYVLPEHRVAVLAFNRRANPMLRIRAALLPEPFLGPLDARGRGQVLRAVPGLCTV